MIGPLSALAQAAWSKAVGRIVGSIDGERHDRFCGWAFDRHNPRRRLVVSIGATPGIRILELADRYRADVQKSGLCDGYCGFSVPLDRLGDRRGIRVFCTFPRVELHDPNTSRRLQSPARSMMFQRGTYTLQLDEMRPDRVISGWALDIASPEIRRPLVLRRDRLIVRSQRATLYRPELVDYQRDGFHGFSLTLPGPQKVSLTLEDEMLGVAFQLNA